MRLVVVTLDSCRFDVALEAETPFLDSVATCVQAFAHATFTLPAHVAMFHGYFPHRADSLAPPSALADLPSFKRWGKDVRTSRGTVEGVTWLDGLRKNGIKTVGAAGMRWFKSDVLRMGFDSFFYWGPEYDAAASDLPEWSLGEFALDHPEELRSAVATSDEWLLFVNAAETHAPYGARGALLQEQRNLALYRNGKERLPSTFENRRIMRDLKMQQARSLSAADQKLRTLFSVLPGPFHFIVTADHGECFGENELWGHVVSDPHVFQVPIWEGNYVP